VLRKLKPAGATEVVKDDSEKILDSFANQYPKKLFFEVCSLNSEDLVKMIIWTLPLNYGDHKLRAPDNVFA
jgi:hypothetical protein